MSYIEMEELMKKVNSRYKLAILAARRTLELNEGKGKLVEVPATTKLFAIALREIQEGKVTYKQKETPKVKE